MNRAIWWSVVVLTVAALALWCASCTPAKGGPVDVGEGATTGDIDTGAESADDPIEPHLDEKTVTLEADSAIYEDKSHTESAIHTETHEFGEGAQKMMGRLWAIGIGLGLLLLGYIIKAPGSLHIRYILGGAGIVVLLASAYALIFAWGG